MPNNASSGRGTTVAQARGRSLLAASRAVQTRQRAETLFQRAERLRRMLMAAGAKAGTGDGPDDAERA